MELRTSFRHSAEPLPWPAQTTQMRTTPPPALRMTALPAITHAPRPGNQGDMLLQPATKHHPVYRGSFSQKKHKKTHYWPKMAPETHEKTQFLRKMPGFICLNPRFEVHLGGVSGDSLCVVGLRRLGRPTRRQSPGPDVHHRLPGRAAQRDLRQRSLKLRFRRSLPERAGRIQTCKAVAMTWGL